MKAVAIFPSTHQVRIIDHPEPKISSPTEVKIRMLEVGICGTDKELCSFDYGIPPDGSDYLIIGHESFGEVVEVGPKVANIKVGDLVYIMVRRPCDHRECIPCRAGRQDFCSTGDFKERGIKQAHGFMTEFVTEDEKYIIVVPEILRPVGVLIDPLTIAEKAIQQLWTVQERLPWEIQHVKGKQGVNHGKGHAHRAIVLGAGAVGLAGAMALVQQEFITFVYSREPASDKKAKIVKTIGATYVSAQTSSIEQLAQQVGNIDVVYEAAGDSQTAFDLLKLLGTNGVFIFTGVPGHKKPVPIDTDLIERNLVLKNQLVLGTVNNSLENARNAVHDLELFFKRWPNEVTSLITERFSMDTEKLEDVLLGRVGGIKNVIAFRDQT